MRYQVEALYFDPPQRESTSDAWPVGEARWVSVEVQAPSPHEACAIVRRDVPGVVFARALYLDGCPPKAPK